jgi:hypothetical protein
MTENQEKKFVVEAVHTRDADGRETGRCTECGAPVGSAHLTDCSKTR